MKKLTASVLATALLSILAIRMQAQGTFQNLDFEASRVSPSQAPGSVSAADALPYWSVYYGDSQSSEVLFNTIGLGSTLVCVLSTNAVAFGRSSLEGVFSVFLQGGLSPTTDASIRQTGLVPATARSIQFKAKPEGGGFGVSLGGQSIPLYPLSSGPNYILYGGDVSAFAGLSGELKFSVLRGGGQWNIDSIVFSEQIVPEPRICALLALGLSILVARSARSGR